MIVVGGGHAGCEAALASARMGAKTLLITMNPETIALMPCNPSVGGPAKSTLVREIDAMGGAMGRMADLSQIQIRMLNTGKGVAVQALRAQIDKPAYQASMLRYLESRENLDIRQGECRELIIESGRISGVRLLSGAEFTAASVVIACGTYLDGRVIIGEQSYSSGPSGYPAAAALGLFLRDLGLPMGRFKTGTPARVDKRSVDLSKMEEQAGDASGLAFSYSTARAEAAARPRVSCWLTYTNEETHQVIRDNLHRSPLYSGIIKGVGPRYCPSIEDKVVRFADRDAHQLFLEPEGLAMREYYVQGMSSSLPEDVQIAFLRTIAGLEQVSIVRPAYAIEYDCLQPTQLSATLEHKEISGLFSAGQLNGTSGYEEAAAQGLLAGINAAARALDLPPLVFGRADCYIGVMVDDLVTKGVAEPYRLFTSLSEYRLLLRQDNADMRLFEKAYEYGLIDEAFYEKCLRKRQSIAEETKRLESTHPNAAQRQLFSVQSQSDTTLAAVLRRPEMGYALLCDVAPPDIPVEPEVAQQVEINIKYAGYIEKQCAQAEKFLKLEKLLLPAEIDYAAISGLSLEAAQKLARFRPDSIGQAGRITGISPADISVLLIYMEQRRRKNALIKDDTGGDGSND